MCLEASNTFDWFRLAGALSAKKRPGAFFKSYHCFFVFFRRHHRRGSSTLVTPTTTPCTWARRSIRWSGSRISWANTCSPLSSKPGNPWTSPSDPMRTKFVTDCLGLSCQAAGKGVPRPRVLGSHVLLPRRLYIVYVSFHYLFYFQVINTVVSNPVLPFQNHRIFSLFCLWFYICSPFFFVKNATATKSSIFERAERGHDVTISKVFPISKHLQTIAFFN